MKISKTQTVVELDSGDLEKIIKEHIKRELPGHIEDGDIVISTEETDDSFPHVSIVVTHDLNKIPTPSFTPHHDSTYERRVMPSPKPQQKQQKYDENGEPIAEYVDNLNVDDVLASKFSAGNTRNE